ncbi:MAG: hypothetical protein E4G94_08845 [ANME-2 cluster archaeon]|nr:MAG: hypothetical protein E4G94_08845 [ANME-2 cluster archaeon]
MLKKIEESLFNFKMAYFYTFISGIFAALSINIFTIPLFNENISVSVDLVYTVASLALLSSISAFMISVRLEIARDEWQSDGTPNDKIVIRQDYIEKGMRKISLWFFFILFILLLISFILIIIGGQYNYI